MMKHSVPVWLFKREGIVMMGKTNVHFGAYKSSYLHMIYTVIVSILQWTSLENTASLVSINPTRLVIELFVTSS